MNNKYLLSFLFLFVMQIDTSVSSTLTLEEQREKFILAETLIKKGNEKAFVFESNQLKDYPLYPYLQYQWLRDHLNQTTKIKAFLKDHSNTRYARFLKKRWLFSLAKQKKWKTFIKHYKATNNAELQCHYYTAKYQTGAKKTALKGAKKLWVKGKSQPKACDRLFSKLMKSSFFNKQMRWDRFAAALNKRNTGLAKYVKNSMSKKDQKNADLWLKVYSNPWLVNDSALVKPKNKNASSIFTHGIERLLRQDSARAVEIWDKRNKAFKITDKKKQRIENKLALFLALDRDKTAYQRLSHVKNLNNSGQEWRIRAALREQKWDQVAESIKDLNNKKQKTNRWQYWLARALEKNNKSNEANSIFKQLSKERSYYGYLSSNKLKQDYQLVDNPVQVNKAEIAEFKQKTDFKMVPEFIAVNKLLEAKKQWWYALKKLNDKDILTAAKYAQQLGLTQVSIFTLAKAKYWDDVSVRFPLAYEENVKSQAKKQSLDPAIIYGLIRRESAFEHEATSPVGARGLMQIMPKTGRQIAKELNEKWKSEKVLFDPATNIRFGSYYYKQLLEQFNGHYALAAAAYNAGPHRVKRWLPNSDTLPADIWIETIPFKETRAYVSAVLTYALIYQKQMKTNSLSMNVFMAGVYPNTTISKLN